MRYPWTQWTDGNHHEIVRGRDFGISVHNMQISLHGRARAKGLKVQSRAFKRREPDAQGFMQSVEGLTFQFQGD